MTRAIVTDIEGTVSSITFVKDVLFPYARAAMADFVIEHATDPAVRPLLANVAAQGQVDPADLGAIVGTLQRWIDEDRKQGDLKALQGMIWHAGYTTGQFTAPIYADAVSAIQTWDRNGVPLYVYSSGSVPAQKLLFGFSDAGDLTAHFSGWFDTAVGGKREVDSYRTIASDIGVPADEILFLSDIVEELDAARAAGWETILIDRPQDYAQPRQGDATNGHRRVTSFAQI